jgi:hypothetical protein
VPLLAFGWLHSALLAAVQLAIFLAQILRVEGMLPFGRRMDPVFDWT